MKHLLKVLISFLFLYTQYSFSKSVLTEDRQKAEVEFKQASAFNSPKTSYFGSRPIQNVDWTSISCAKEDQQSLQKLGELKINEVRSFLIVNFYNSLLYQSSTGFVNYGMKASSFHEANILLKTYSVSFNKVLALFEKRFRGLDFGSPETLAQVEDYLDEVENIDQSRGELEEDSGFLYASIRDALRAFTEKSLYDNLFSEKKNCGIRLAEYQSLVFYTGVGYSTLGKGSLLPAEIKNAIKAIESNVASFLKKLKPESRVVRIGTYLNKSEWQKILSEGVISYEAFVSGSINSTYDSFAQNAIIKVIKNKTGAWIAPFSGSPHEGEVIWHKPTFKIKNASLDESQRLWLEVEEI